MFLELIIPLNLSHIALLVTAGFFLFTYAIQIHRFVKFRKGSENPGAVLLTFVVFGIFIHLFCAALTKKIIMLMPLQAVEAQVSGLFIFLALVFNVKGIHTGLKGPKLKNVSVKVPETYSSLNGLKIVQISDLHVGPLINSKYILPIVEQIKKINPDILVFTGDIGDGDSKYYAHELKSFESVVAPLGKYYVTGNHEHMWGADGWIDAVKALNIQPLINQGVQIHSDLYIAGVPDISSSRFAFTASNPQQAIQGGNGFKVLLAHQPKSCIEAEKAGFDLMLSGHTHNGQFFPFNLVVGFFNPYSKGLNQHGNMQVYVNSGTGFWGPPLRLGVESEITVLTLKNDDDNK
ncbi:MAG: metallophosphoesterase [Pseudobdellovibrionaceae bacterium]